MKIGISLAALLLGGSATLLGQMSAEAVPGGKGGSAGGEIGADVAVCNMPAISRWGTVGGVSAYSVGTTSVNLGDVNLEWYANSNRHPRMPMNMFRWADCRLEQIGYSWCKDGFCALQLNECGACQPAGGGCPQLLGPGCSDPYSSSLNGSQGGLAPRWQCDPSTGEFQYPPTGLPSAAPTVGRRIQVLQADLSPQQNPGAKYYVDSMYLHPQDYESNNQLNNSSYKRMVVGSLSGSGYSLTPTGSTFLGKPAIFAWEDNSDTVAIKAVDIPNDGRVFVASDVCDNGDGTYRYNYAVYNLTSKDAINGISIPLPAGVEITDAEFKFPAHHSGDPYSNDAWVISEDGGSLTFAGAEFSQNPDANAVRWAMMYNFSFTADAEPADGAVVLDRFESNSTIGASGLAVPGGPSNPYDLNGDGIVNGSDVGIFFTQWGAGCGSFADFNGDCIVNSADAGMMFAAWG
ncbi:MAG: hypothetical protein GY728_12590 [Phycisphaeraceae bacterium]|nr:hypothetical protein [Phycisphaeraceae bacterium]MCP4497974.1 hypothetical protein [Phycisphaeraceae bacterium]MCP4794909.1 hypothetical protein [Phycisphaeraceae bacterium]MCP4939511.1 hypothetical protein [Phycisphaeraceae bacterium]